MAETMKAQAQDIERLHATASDHLFLGGSAWLEHKFLEVLGPTPWTHCWWHAMQRGGSAACYARHPQMQFFHWWGRWRGVGTTLQYAATFQDIAVVGPPRLPLEAGAGGEVRVFTHLDIWAPNMSPTEAEPLPLAAFNPPPGLRTCWTHPPPPPRPGVRGGGGSHGKSSVLGTAGATPPPPPLTPPGPRETVDSLLLIPVTARALRLRDLWADPPALCWRASRDSGSGHSNCPRHTNLDGIRPAPLRCNTHRHRRASCARV